MNSYQLDNIITISFKELVDFMTDNIFSMELLEMEEFKALELTITEPIINLFLKFVMVHKIECKKVLDFL